MPLKTAWPRWRIIKHLNKVLEGEISDLVSPWDDLRFPVTAVNPPGQASDPDVDTTHGTLLFAATGTETIFVTAQLPHTWYAGTDLIPHVHWMKTTSATGNVVWELAYKWAPIGETRDASFTTTTVSSTVAGTPDNDTAGEHLISSFGNLSGTGKDISDHLIFRVSRLGGDAGDTYGSDAELMEFDVHYQKNSLGSKEQFSKT